MNYKDINTIAGLKKSGYTVKSIKQELRDNLVEKLSSAEPIFEGIVGYDETVIPQLTSAILSKHNINLLGLRGQAKTRIARSLVNLLDDYIPFVEGSEINDDPFNPLSKYAVDLINSKGDETPISWLHKSKRFFEKLATPDVTVADLIGDVDPIKAANLKLSYADERVIHYGMIPRANRCIFVINELPDLQARIQVSLFNILQEGDIQIRGFQVRLPLDLQFIFTANPEDYTNRGSIVTPLKDRIGSQILTHYPLSIEIAKEITRQEVKISNHLDDAIYVPDLARILIEQIGFEARNSEFIDSKSGVSARMSITMFENLVSTAEMRLIKSKEKSTSIRMSDFLGITPAITGKVELVYEGEQEGAENVAAILLGDAIKTVFNNHFRAIKKLAKPGTVDEFDAVISWFAENKQYELPNQCSNAAYAKALNSVTPLNKILESYIPDAAEKDKLILKEFLLWGLAEYKKLSKNEYSNGISFGDDLLNSLFN
ncbi:MAG: AAA family ATPase [Bacteroidetes bacterium]|nr:AAA family ATPase [Bacteroidota bacterium]